MDTSSAWGTYAPPSQSFFLRLIISAGLSRGIVKKKILRIWKNEFGPIADISARGIKYRLNIQNNVTDRQILVSSKEYDGTELSALKKACRTGSFLDVGANTGYYSLSLAANGTSKIIAIEPNPPTLERLRFNISINHFEDLITVLPIGVGTPGTSELFSSDDLGSASLIKKESVATNKTTITIRPLLDILTENKITKLGGLKIDIEGMEDRALLPFFKSAPETLWPACLVIEHCNQSDWKTDIISYLLNSGYIKQCETRGNTILVRSSEKNNGN